MATSTPLTSSAAPTWELSKENAAPLARGRDVKALSRALSSSSETDEQRTMNERKVRRFEKFVAPSERAAEEAAQREAQGETGVDANSIMEELLERDFEELWARYKGGEDDPLVHWLSYIKFLQDTYAADTKEQFLLMERCTRSIVAFHRYRNDVRFIRICVLYADKTSAPSDVFKYLHQRKVGTYTSLFWIAWAWVAEKNSDYPFAEKVFLKGLNKKAKPTKILEERHRQFRRRMSRHWLNNASKRNRSDEGGDGEEEADQENRRGALSGLTSSTARHNQRARGANPLAFTSGSSRVDNIGNVGGIRGTSSSSRSRPSSRSQLSNFGSRQDTSSQRQGHNGVKAKGGFSIFVEDDGANNENDGGYNLDQSVDYGQIGGGRRIEKESDRRKENTARTERWNERGGLGTTRAGDGGDDGHYRGSGQSFAARMATRDPSPTPAFQVFVDEECAAKNEKEEEKARQDREQRRREIGDRSLMQRVDGGVADRLTRDPLRYVRNPLKMESDKTKYGDDSIKSAKKKTRRCDENNIPPASKPSNENAKEKKGEKKSSIGFSKKLVSKGKDGQERCFEEGRASARYFNLVSSSTDFNLLEIVEEATMTTKDSSAMDMDASSINDVDMEGEDVNGSVEESNNAGGVDVPMLDNTMQSYEHTTSPGQNSDKRSCSKDPKTRRVLFGLDTSIGSAAAQNVSTASSTVNEKDAVGVPMGKEEETINTKFAMKELSMMFSSPAMGCGDGVANLSVIAAASEQQANESTDSSAKPLFSLHSRKPSKGSIPKEEETPEKDGNGDTATFSLVADLMGNNENNGTSVSILAGPENHCPHNPLARNNRTAGFERCALRSMGSENVAEVETEKKVLGESKSIGICAGPATVAIPDNAMAPTFDIFCDDGANDRDEEVRAGNGTERKGTEAGPAFQIFCDDTEKEDLTMPHVDMASEAPASESAPFSIFVDNNDGSKQEERDNDNEDTATLSVIGETLKGIADADNPQRKGKEGRSVGFMIYKDNESTTGEDKSRRSSRRRRQSMFDRNMKEEDATISKFCQEEENEVENKSNCEIALVDDNVITDNVDLRFGDLSRIAPSHVADNVSFSEGIEEEPVEYDEQHGEDVEMALRETMKEAARHSNCAIMDHRSISMPRALLQKLPTKGVEIEIGNVVATVKHELGRGAYGVVLLCDSNDGTQEFSSALKVQTPTGCLAWEFDILRKIEERLPQLEGPTKRVTSTRRRSRDDADNSEALPPFPRALSFVNFSDGGLLSMTAGSTSGSSLVDAVNAHRGTGGGPVPEVIAIHYTARMLKHVESLHFYGKILHCDIKPDNWVLTASASACGAECDALIAGSDLMLVDFGRAIDLTRMADGAPDPKKLRLCGDAAAKDMACGAMRDGLPWAADIDTYGICASAFVLLYGFHMDIEKDRMTKRWKPHKPLRRYWNKALWKELFDTLLNEDGSDPNSMRALRKSFESYLDEGNRRKDLEAELKHQASILPKKR